MLLGGVGCLGVAPRRALEAHVAAAWRSPPLGRRWGPGKPLLTAATSWHRVQVSLKLQKRLAASVLGCGLRKVWLDPNEVNDISMANSSEWHHPRACRAAGQGAGAAAGRLMQAPGTGRRGMHAPHRAQAAQGGGGLRGGRRRQWSTWAAAGLERGRQWAQPGSIIHGGMQQGGRGRQGWSLEGKAAPSPRVQQHKQLHLQPADRTSPARASPAACLACCRAERAQAGEGRLHHPQAAEDPLPLHRARSSRGQGQGSPHRLRCAPRRRGLVPSGMGLAVLFLL